MHQTNCQKCGTANRTDAIVCTECGTKLDHRERSTFSRIRKSQLGQSVTEAPGRLFKWTFRRITTLLITVFFTAGIGIGCLYFLLFLPLTWDQYPKSSAIYPDDPEVRQQIYVLCSAGGMFSAGVENLRTLGQIMIFNPTGETPLPEKKKTKDDEKYFSIVKLPHDRFGLVLYQKYYGVLPFRLMAVFAAKREKNGQLQLDSCRMGNLPVSPGILRQAAERMLADWNPNQQFLKAFDRIYRGEMDLNHKGGDDKIRLYIHGIRN